MGICDNACVMFVGDDIMCGTEAQYYRHWHWGRTMYGHSVGRALYSNIQFKQIKIDSFKTLNVSPISQSKYSFNQNIVC